MTSKELADEWRQYDNNSWGVFTPIALHFGLTIEQCGIIRFIHRAKIYFSEWERYTKDGVEYIWVNHETLMKKLAVLGCTDTHQVTRRVNAMIEKGVLLRETHNLLSMRKSFYGIPPTIEPFLFAHAALEEGYTYEDIATKWLEYLNSGKVTDMPTPSKEPTPLFGDSTPTKETPKFTGKFQSFLEKAFTVCKLNVTLYKKDGEPQKAALKLQAMYEAMLDGTFNEKFKPSSSKYRYENIGKVTEEEILQALKYIGSDHKSLVEPFMAWKSQRSDVFANIARARKEVVPPKEDVIPDDDKYFNDFMHNLHRFNHVGYKASDTDRLAFYRMHKWIDANYKDLDAINKGRPSFKGGLGGQEGEWVAMFINKTRQKPYDLSNLSVDHPWWKKFAEYAYKAFSGVRFILDDGMVRRMSEREQVEEELYQIRGYEIDEYREDDY